MIEDAYTLGEAMGLQVWCEDEAGPFQTVPHAGRSWQPVGKPARVPHEYIRNGTAKRAGVRPPLTLFHPRTGRVHVRGTRSCTNEVLHGWMQGEWAEILGAAPEPASPEPASPEHRPAWERWQEGLTIAFTLPAEVPPLRALLVLDNLTGHKTPSLVLWLIARGVMPLYTPLGGIPRSVARG